MQQVYQGLTNYNGSSTTNFSGVLSSGWVESFDAGTGFSTYTFELRPGVESSNGNPYNAYVQWYSLYRSLLLEQGAQFLLAENFYSTNFNSSDPLNYYSPLANSSAANATLASDLNSWNFAVPTSAKISQMELPNQSFHVVNSETIALNLGFGYLDSNYTYLLASISAPNSYAVDPSWVDAHGGIQEGQVNNYLATHALGTGPYTLNGYDGVAGGGYALEPSSNYWASSVAPANRGMSTFSRRARRSTSCSKTRST
ncbi:MAG: ABC transporter substrate-binding protein [Thermoplasmata archaeon]